MTLNHELRGALRSWAFAQGRLAMKRTVHLGMALVLALTLLIGGLSLSAPSAHAATTTPNSPSSASIGAFCQSLGVPIFSQYLTELASLVSGQYTPILLSQGACASLVVTLANGQVSSSAIFASICQNVAYDYQLPPPFVGLCVSTLTQNKALDYHFQFGV
jgi:hypothetical protein